LPACPGFYHQPRRVEDLVDQVCAKVLDVCGIPQEKITRWQGSE
jgi:4-hydroxy-3-polyprenylbenzoate decarboxylase